MNFGNLGNLPALHMTLKSAYMAMGRNQDDIDSTELSVWKKIKINSYLTSYIKTYST